MMNLEKIMNGSFVLPCPTIDSPGSLSAGRYHNSFRRAVKPQKPQKWGRGAPAKKQERKKK